MSDGQVPRPGDAEVLAAYRELRLYADRTVVHVAGCKRCNPGYRRPEGDIGCEGYAAAYRADCQEALAAGSGERA